MNRQRCLFAVLAVIALMWMVALPWVSQAPRIQQHLDWLEEHQLDPSARYYTDLPAMEPILNQLDGQN